MRKSSSCALSSTQTLVKSISSTAKILVSIRNHTMIFWKPKLMSEPVLRKRYHLLLCAKIHILSFSIRGRIIKSLSTKRYLISFWFLHPLSIISSSMSQARLHAVLKWQRMRKVFLKLNLFWCKGTKPGTAEWRTKQSKRGKHPIHKQMKQPHSSHVSIYFRWMTSLNTSKWLRQTKRTPRKNLNLLASSVNWTMQHGKRSSVITTTFRFQMNHGAKGQLHMKSQSSRKDQSWCFRKRKYTSLSIYLTVVKTAKVKLKLRFLRDTAQRTTFTIKISLRST